MKHYHLDVVVTRGGLVESRHRVHAAVVDARGKLIGVSGDPAVVSFWRSGSKPFQVIPFVAEDGLDDLGWGDDELALACASHGGEPEHVSLAEAMLRDIGLEEGDLACGAHEPLSLRGVRLAREAGTRISRLHNNCSGKHSTRRKFRSSNSTTSIRMAAQRFPTKWPKQQHTRLSLTNMPTAFPLARPSR